MGDRANVYVIDDFASQGKNETVGVYLYTHWGGSDLPETLADALGSKAGQGRLSDTPYLTRIIFCRMIAGDVDGETGYGIGTVMADNEYPIVVVDTEKQEVRIVSEGSERLRDATPLARWSFKDFVQNRPSWPVR